MLLNYIPRKTYAVAAAYEYEEIVSLVAGAEIYGDNTIRLHFPKRNPFLNHKSLTLHLDNRTGVESFDADLRVYRCSYKGALVESDEYSALISPLEYQVVYSSRIVDQYKAPVFVYPEDTRTENEIEETALKELVLLDEKEHGNKLGVLITKNINIPHTTVMAFLSTIDDDIFIITHRGTRKSVNLHRDSRCCFAIDHRSTFLFEKAYEWNYTIVKGVANKISVDNEMFSIIQQKLIEKNPWELVFFSSPLIEMYHIKPVEILCPDTFRRA